MSNRNEAHHYWGLSVPKFLRILGLSVFALAISTCDSGSTWNESGPLPTPPPPAQSYFHPIENPAIAILNLPDVKG